MTIEIIEYKINNERTKHILQNENYVVYGNREMKKSGLFEENRDYLWELKINSEFIGFILFSSGLIEYEIEEISEEILKFYKKLTIPEMYISSISIKPKFRKKGYSIEVLDLVKNKLKYFGIVSPNKAFSKTINIYYKENKEKYNTYNSILILKSLPSNIEAFIPTDLKLFCDEEFRDKFITFFDIDKEMFIYSNNETRIELINDFLINIFQDEIDINPKVQLEFLEKKEKNLIIKIQEYICSLPDKEIENVKKNNGPSNKILEDINNIRKKYKK